jgi:acyl-CoA synthetase (AMP-forming)/AMP-acid ligase II
MTAMEGVRTLGELSTHHAAERPEKLATIYEGRATTYAETERRAVRAANGLIAAGLGPQTRVALLARNTDRFMEVWFGAAKANMVLVPVNWRLAPPEVSYIIADARAEVLFVGEEFFALIERIRDELDGVHTIVALSGAHPKWESYESWSERQDEAPPEVAIAGSEVAAQLYTSGTTGLPKGAQISNHNLLSGLLSKMDRNWGEWSDADVSLVAMPLFHIGGCGYALLGFYAGGTNVIMPEVDPGRIIAAIAEHRITKVFFVPAVILFILQHPNRAGADFSSVDELYYGASPIPQELLREALEVFACKFSQVYGLTETTGAITRLRPEDHDPERPELLLSCGQAMGDIEIAILDENDQPKPTGQVGEIVCRSSQNMVGYWNRPEDTAEAMRGGWFHTGDAGYLDEKGYLYIYDRINDMIISGGENIYPAEVESALFAHPAVADVAAIGVPDERYGEAVKAVVVRKPDAEVSENELIDFARGRIAHFKAPKSVDFVDELPRNPSGKILKRELRAPYWKGRERQVG